MGQAQEPSINSAQPGVEPGTENVRQNKNSPPGFELQTAEKKRKIKILYQELTEVQY